MPLFTTEDTIDRGRTYNAPDQSGNSSPLMKFLGYDSQGGETGWGKALGWVPGLNILSNVAARSMATGEQHDKIASETKSRIFRTIAEAGIVSGLGGGLAALGGAAGASGAVGGAAGVGATVGGAAPAAISAGAPVAIGTTASGIAGATGAAGTVANAASQTSQIGKYTKLLQQLYNGGGKDLLNNSLQSKPQQQSQQQGQYLITY